MVEAGQGRSICQTDSGGERKSWETGKYKSFLENDDDSDDGEANYDFQHGNMRDYLNKVS